MPPVRTKPALHQLVALARRVVRLVDLEPLAGHVQRAGEQVAGEQIEPALARPFLAHVVWGAEAGGVVDHRSTAQTRAGQDEHAQVMRRAQPAVEVRLAQHVQLELAEVGLGQIGAPLEDDDVVAGFGQFDRQHPAARA
jgi:hypothetical protein